MSQTLNNGNKTQDQSTQINGHVGSVVIFHLQGKLQLISKVRSGLFQLSNYLR